MWPFRQDQSKRVPALPSDESVIEFRQLIAELTNAELRAHARGYFSELTPESEQCFKPFSNPGDAVTLTYNLSFLLRAADLFPGSDVLDFGCGTGWLTIALANLEAHVIGIDIADSALRLAQSIARGNRVRAGGSVAFIAFDGDIVPIEDESVDRVLCFDSFHHVRDMPGTLRELARVLRPGGRIAMLEPGPNHSKTPQSQREMALFRVIESDIVMGDIARWALDAGLSHPRMLPLPGVPAEMDLENYETLARARTMRMPDATRFAAAFCRQVTDTQCFYLTKPGPALDSRRTQGLQGVIEWVIRPVAEGDVVRFTVRVQNTGEAVWRSQAWERGGVNLGCQVLAPDGTVTDQDFIRFPLGDADVHPGMHVDLPCEIPLELAQQQGAIFRFDLVAELVAWFSELGRTSPLDWRIPS
jgi:ubiquinone/menaquinone biosynthesis C-methylase UbiE